MAGAQARRGLISNNLSKYSEWMSFGAFAAALAAVLNRQKTSEILICFLGSEVAAHDEQPRI
jgi:hypothetical protein